jgi:hypothetical protein
MAGSSPMAASTASQAAASTSPASAWASTTTSPAAASARTSSAPWSRPPTTGSTSSGWNLTVYTDNDIAIGLYRKVRLRTGGPAQGLRLPSGRVCRCLCDGAGESVKARDNRPKTEAPATMRHAPSVAPGARYVTPRSAPATHPRPSSGRRVLAPCRASSRHPDRRPGCRSSSTPNLPPWRRGFPPAPWPRRG